MPKRDFDAQDPAARARAYRRSLREVRAELAEISTQAAKARGQRAEILALMRKSLEGREAWFRSRLRALERRQRAERGR